LADINTLTKGIKMSRVKVQGPSGKIVLLDQIRQDAFDTITLDENSTINEEREFFSNIQGKKPYQTNLNQANLLEKNVSFLIMAMQLDAHVTDAENANFLAQLSEYSSIRLKIGERDFWKGAARFVTGKIYSEGYASTTVADTTIEKYYQQYGCTTNNGVLFGKDAHEIPSLFSFKVIMASSVPAGVAVAAGTEVNLVMRLKGLQRRPVQ
jgi:hypothetical protein